MTERALRQRFYAILARFRGMVRASYNNPEKDTWQYRKWLEENVKPTFKRFIYDHEGKFHSGEIRSTKGLLFTTRT